MKFKWFKRDTHNIEIIGSNPMMPNLSFYLFFYIDVMFVGEVKNKANFNIK